MEESSGKLNVQCTHLLIYENDWSGPFLDLVSNIQIYVAGIFSSEVLISLLRILKFRQGTFLEPH